MKVFLGGTCGTSNWREEFIPMLTIDYFNPLVENWTEKNKIIENTQKNICDYNLFVLTSETTGLFSIAEALDQSNKNPFKTIFCLIEDGFDKAQLDSFHAICQLITHNGALVFYSLKEVADFLNNETIIRFIIRLMKKDI